MSKLLEILKETEEKCDEYQRIALECENSRQNANELLEPHKELLGKKMREIAETAYPPLLKQTYQGVIVHATQMGKVNVELYYAGWLKTEEKMAQGKALDLIDSEFMQFAAKQLGIPKEKVNPVLIVKRSF